MADETRECPPCRGTGTIISSAGGDAHAVTCPWCDGAGVRPATTPRPQ